MVNLIDIEDPADARLAEYQSVHEGRRRKEADRDWFLCEGVLLVERLLDSDLPVRSLLITPGKLDRLRPLLRGDDLDVFVAPQDVLNATVGFNMHRGAIASAGRREAVPVKDLLAASQTVAVLEGINDHENLGAIFRSALALGIDAVLLDQTSGDPYYRRTVRVSMGAAFTLPFARLGGAENLFELLDGAGYVSIALTPDPGATSVSRVKLAPGTSAALLLGAEGDGLRPETLRAATMRVRIPIRPGVDSLNVGHAAAVAFHRFGSVDNQSVV
ncbi:MAG: RNA methyltransferase [Acidimicrobiia bacterium]|nr:RNA methyltransferase [Acidimicrobiia bacterium]